MEKRVSSKRKAGATAIRRRVPTETLRRIDCGDGTFVYTNLSGVVVAIEYDKGDGVVRRVNLTT